MTKKIAKPEEIWFENEETRLQGWLLKPNDFDAKKRYPLILEIHGGPHILFGYNLFFEFQYLVSQKYLVFYMNPRGSQGYGPGPDCGFPGAGSSIESGNLDRAYPFPGTGNTDPRGLPRPPGNRGSVWRRSDPGTDTDARKDVPHQT